MYELQRVNDMVTWTETVAVFVFVCENGREEEKGGERRSD